MSKSIVNVPTTSCSHWHHLPKIGHHHVNFTAKTHFGQMVVYSSDSTSHKHIKYECRTIALQVIDSSNPDVKPEWKLQTLGIGTSVNHVSQTQFDACSKNWQRYLTTVLWLNERACDSYQMTLHTGFLVQAATMQLTRRRATGSWRSGNLKLFFNG